MRFIFWHTRWIELDANNYSNYKPVSWRPLSFEHPAKFTVLVEEEGKKTINKK